MRSDYGYNGDSGNRVVYGGSSNNGCYISSSDNGEDIANEDNLTLSDRFDM